MKKDQTHTDQKLLVLFLLDEISQSGRTRVEAWLNASEENRNLFEGLKRTWDETGKIDPASVAFDTGMAWERMAGRIKWDESEERQERQERQEGQERRRREESRVEKLKRVNRAGSFGRPDGSRKTGWTGGMERFLIALAAVLLLGVASIVLVRQLKSRQDEAMLTLAGCPVPVEDILTDGSRVILNTGTKLVVPKKFTRNRRTVDLSGEAFFQVVPDADRPFTIDAGLGKIEVLGTSFHVKAYPDSDLEVYVESGSVELSAADSVPGIAVRIVLKAGERGMIRKGSGVIGKPDLIGPDELFWASKKLIFQETKLSLVFSLLKKHYDADIEVNDEAILNCLLSATFTNEPVDQILAVVAASFDLKISRDKQKFIFNGKGCAHE